VRNKIDEEVRRIVEEGPETFRNMCTDEYIDNFAVRPSEIRGLTTGGVIDESYSGVAGRIHGLNHPGDPWMNVYSSSIRPKFTESEMEIIRAATDIPDDLIPRDTDTAQSLKDRLGDSEYFDVLLMRRSGKLHHKMKSTKQSYRRFMSSVKEIPHVYVERDGEGYGKSVMTSYDYIMPEVQPDSRRCRPTREIHQCFMNIVFKYVYGYLTEASRARPPNGLHNQVYFCLLESAIEKHKDNCVPEELENILQGEFDPSAPRPSKCTFQSQTPGTNVILFSFGGNRPMTFKLWYPSRHNKIGRREATSSNITMQFPLGDGWITVLDPIDDILMYHSVFFECNGSGTAGSKHDTTGYRVAWVMRWLQQPQDFFVDTCGLRRNRAMMKKYGHQKTCDSQYPETIRNIFS
jgi:hypothetical protein